MIKRNSFAALAVAVLATAGCTSDGYIDQRQTGAVVGGALGAVGGGLAGTQVGSGRGRTAAIIAGSVLGGVLGSAVGSRLTAEDNRYATSATQQALSTAPPGQPVSWQNPQTGTYGTVVPTSPQYTYQAPPGSPYYGTSLGQQDCRDYKQTIYVEGEQYEVAQGRACRQADGTWRIVS